MQEQRSGLLSLNELDFEGIKANLRQYLKQQDRFKDYNFDGSNISVLIDLLSMNSYLNAHYLNMVGSEMWLDTAQMRESVVSHAKELNYVPRSMTAATAFVNIAVNVGNTAPPQVVIPKYYPLKSTVDGVTYTFTTDEAIVLTAATNYVASNIPIREGIVISEYFEADTDSRFVIQSANVDISSINVTVQNSNTDTTTTTWFRTTSLYGLTPDSRAFFVQGAEDFRYEIVFGNDVVGSGLEEGNIVRVIYRACAGSEANGIKRFEAKQAVDGYTQINVTTVLEALGGQEHESVESIKFNAPRFFTTQERAITETDYATLIRQQFPSFQTVIAYGGERAEPRQYGKVIISGKIAGRTTVPTRIKQSVVEYVKSRAALSIDPIFVDPEYLYVDITSRVTYNLNSTLKSSNDIIADVQEQILSFSNTYLSAFGSDLLYSRLVRDIDNAETSIVSNDTTLKLISKHTPVAGSISSYSFSYDNALIFRSSSEPAIISSRFTHRKGDIAYDDCFIRDNGDGILRIYQQTQGAQILLVDRIGIIDYTTGTVKVPSLSVEGIQGATLNFYAQLVRKDIEVAANRILAIEPLDVHITTEAVRA